MVPKYTRPASTWPKPRQPSVRRPRRLPVTGVRRHSTRTPAGAVDKKTYHQAKARTEHVRRIRKFTHARRHHRGRSLVEWRAEPRVGISAARLVDKDSETPSHAGDVFRQRAPRIDDGRVQRTSASKAEAVSVALL